jgi:hypothetical protein
MEILYGLSIRQPWLDMIVRGVKTMEIRSWKVQHRGVIALHAPRRIDFSPAYFYGYQSPWLLPRSKIVAVAEITDVSALDTNSWQMFLEQHRQPWPIATGTYGVLLTNVRALEHPIAYRGRRGLFPVAETIAERVRRAVRF